MKRFWAEARAVAEPGGFVVELDGKPLRLPGGERLRVGSKTLAHALAEEWRGAADEFGIDELRLTRLAGTAQERVAPDRASVALALARYAESDLLCYRAAAPPALVERQARLWQPWLDWAAKRFGAHLVATEGVRHVAQDPAALATLAGAVSVCDVAAITGLGVLVPALGSLVLGLAVVSGDLAPERAFRLSVLDEDFQAEQWGEDALAAARRAEVEAEVSLAARYVELAHE